MALEEKVEQLIKEINDLYNAASRIKWAEVSRDGFVFELGRATKKLKEIYMEFEEVSKETKLLLEQGTPDISDFIEDLQRELVVLESNLAMERTKKVRENIVNAREAEEVPELYSSLQEKVLAISLKARYNVEKVKMFLFSKKTPFVKKGSTAKNLINLLQRREEEINDLKQKHLELKRQSFFGLTTEKSLAETERELIEMDKRLNAAVTEANKALKTHNSQMSYVEGSFANLKRKVEELYSMHDAYSRKTLEVIQELKKERDYARTTALSIEHEAFKMRSEHSAALIGIEEKKAEIEENANAKYEGKIRELKKELDDKALALKNLGKTLEEQEKEIKALKHVKH